MREGRVLGVLAKHIIPAPTASHCTRVCCESGTVLNWQLHATGKGDGSRGSCGSLAEALAFVNFTWGLVVGGAGAESGVPQ